MSLPPVGTEFYLVVAPKDSSNLYKGLATPRITKGKPALRSGEIALRFTLRMPRSLFEDFIPAGHIEIPEDASVGRPALRVEVPEGLRLDDPGIRLQLVPVEGLGK